MSMAWIRYPSVFDEVTAYVSKLAQRAWLYKSKMIDIWFSFRSLDGTGEAVDAA
jgi:hypothetical protein